MEWWAKPTDDDLDVIGGKRDQLVGELLGQSEAHRREGRDADQGGRRHEQGTVYLTGNVENDGVKARATELARGVSGVREVVNNLKIQ